MVDQRFSCWDRRVRRGRGACSATRGGERVSAEKEAREKGDGEPSCRVDALALVVVFRRPEFVVCPGGRHGVEKWEPGD